jgi:hypothetical protein
MNRRFSFLALAVVAALALSAPARAGNVLVYADSGGTSADVHGTATGATVDTAAYVNDAINTINNTSISPTLALAVSMTLTSTGTFITGGTGSKVIDGTTLAFTVDDGVITKTGVIVDATITSVTGSTPGYDFSPLNGGAVTITLSDTATNFKNVFHHSGTKVTASGLGVQESSVPEPASIAMLGIGMTGLLAFRRLFRRAKV